MQTFLAPRTVKYRGNMLSRIRAGDSPGSYRYANGTGWGFDLFATVVVSTGGRFHTLVKVIGTNRTIKLIETNHYVGQHLLVGPLIYGMAEHSWSVKVVNRSARKTGTIFKVCSPTHGFVRCDQRGNEALVHINNFDEDDPFTLALPYSLHVGNRISYKEVMTDRGLKAVKIQWA